MTMSDDRGNAAGYLGWFFFGTALGAAAALLLTPKTGQEARELLTQGSGDVAKKNQPRYPAALPRSSLMVISLILSQALDERLHAFLDPRRHTDELPGARQAAEHSHEPREPVGDALDLVGHRADALKLPTRLARERADVFGQPVGLAHERPQLLLDDRQHALGALRDPPERPDGRGERQHQDQSGQRQERLRPERHGV